MFKKIQEGGFFRRAAVINLAVFWVAGACVWAVPVAIDDVIDVTNPSGAEFELSATGTSGTTHYIIETLPVHGWLFDAFDGLEIIEDDLPYTMQDNDFLVIYQPCPYYVTGDDTFTFKASDSTGDSNTATITLQMATTDIVYESGSPDIGIIPLDTFYKKARAQTLYHAAEVGARAQSFTHLALDVVSFPLIPIENWTIRMKHTTETEYPSPGEFDNTGWTIVYTNPSESITSIGWVEFAFQTPFDYDGVSNLMIDFSFNSSVKDGGAYGELYNSDTFGEIRIIYHDEDTDDPFDFTDSSFELPYLFNITLQGVPERLYADFNYSCGVEMDDLLTMIDSWLAADGDANYNPACDISIVVDQKVNLADFAIFAPEWLSVLP